MMRITLEVIPRGDESKKFIAGQLEIVNDTTGSPATGNYDLKLTGPVKDGVDNSTMNEFWGRARLNGFPRKLGWWSCVKAALGQFKTDYD